MVSRLWILLLLLQSTAGILNWSYPLLAVPPEGAEAAGEWQSPFVPEPIEGHGP